MKDMVRLSTKLLNAVRLAPEPQYELAHRIGVSPSQLSAWVCGIYTPRATDARVFALGTVLGLQPTDCFEQLGPRDTQAAMTSGQERAGRRSGKSNGKRPDRGKSP